MPRQYLLFLLGIVLLWPALLNGDAFRFRDTMSYLRGADAAVFALTGYRSPNFASNSHVAAVAHGTGRSTPALPANTGLAAAPERVEETPPPPGTQARPMVIHGRSVYFGVLLYLGVLAGSLWLPVVLQTALATVVTVAAVRHAVDPRDGRRFALASIAASALLSVTSLPWFAGFLMPDLLVGLAIVAAALLLTGWRRERPAWRITLLGVMALAAVSHSSAVAVLLVLGASSLGAGILWRRWRLSQLAGLLVIAAALLGVAGDIAFATATRITTGTDPVRPPFLTARLVAGGPGQRYLDERCDATRFVLCRYPLRGRMTEEIFLWSEIPGRGGFKALPPEDARRVAAEQTAFAIAVARAYPAQTAVTLLHDLGVQLGQFSLGEFRPAYSASSVLMAPHQPERVAGTPRNDAVLAATRAVPPILAGLTVLAILLQPMIVRRATAASGPVLVVCAGILANDIVCAVLSGPFPRYQTRVIWALPLVVLLWLIARRFTAQTGPLPRAAVRG